MTKNEGTTQKNKSKAGFLIDYATRGEFMTPRRATTHLWVLAGYEEFVFSVKKQKILGNLPSANQRNTNLPTKRKTITAFGLWSRFEY